MPLLLFFLLLVLIAAGWLLPRYFRSRRRGAYRARPFPREWIEILNSKVALYGAVPETLREELHGHVNVFLAEKTFRGCDGLIVSAEMKVVIATQACVLLLGRNTNYFPGFTTILLYPDTYVVPEVEYDGFVESLEHEARAGESWHRGPVVLSWADVLEGAARPRDGYNVVLHEFAHKLDEENEFVDGLPVLGGDAKSYETWATVLSAEFGLLQTSAAQGEGVALDDYGATSPAEFFAVATETFFEKPKKLKRNHAELYAVLMKLYKVDPSSWYD